MFWTLLDERSHSRRKCFLTGTATAPSLHDLETVYDGACAHNSEGEAMRGDSLRHAMVAALCLMFGGTQLLVAQISRTVTQVTLPPQISSVALNPTSATGGSQVVGTVTLNRAAPSAGTSVALASSNSALAAVPQGVVVPAGATSATFIVQTQPVAANPNVVTSPPSVQISAKIGTNTPATVNLTILPPTLTALTVNPVDVPGGATATATVTLSGPAASGGVVIALSTQSATTESTKDLLAIRTLGGPRISAPSQVTIPAGSPSASFAVTTTETSEPTAFQITATFSAFVSKTATLTVHPPALASLSIYYYDPYGPGSFPATVTLTGPAPAGGFPLSVIAYQGTGGVTGTFAFCGEKPTVPPTVVVPGGATSATFKVQSMPGYGVYVIKATAGGVSKYIDVRPVPPLFNPVFPSSSVKGGTVVQATLQLSGQAMPPDCGNRYQLASSNTTYAQVPAYVDVPTGTTQATFPITTTPLPASAPSQTVTISVTGRIINYSTVAEHTVSANLTIKP